MPKQGAKKGGRKSKASGTPALPARPPEIIRELASRLIYTLRGQRVILDADVAEFYGRTTSAVNQQRSRNLDRFPESFAFQLTGEEWADLKSQFVISRSHGGRRSPPWAYTEHGFTMLATRLRGEQAAFLTQTIIETFVSYRRGTLPAERALPGPGSNKHRRLLQDTIYQQMEALLKMDLPTGETFGREVSSITASAIGRMKAVLDNPKLKNEHLSAEIRKLEAETAKLFAEVRKTDAESANIWADTYQKRLHMIAQLREMAVQLERDDVMDALEVTFGEADDVKVLQPPPPIKRG